MLFLMMVVPLKIRQDPLQSVGGFTLNVFFFCRTVPCSTQQCWTRPPHQSELHFDLHVALLPLSVIVNLSELAALSRVVCKEGSVLLLYFIKCSSAFLSWDSLKELGY